MLRCSRTACIQPTPAIDWVWRRVFHCSHLAVLWEGPQCTNVAHDRLDRNLEYLFPGLAHEYHKHPKFTAMGRQGARFKASSTSLFLLSRTSRSILQMTILSTMNSLFLVAHARSWCSFV